MKTAITIALAGNPNAGKTTLFNHLTGARQHVGNYPGVTVEQKEGCCLHKKQGLRVVDLPGTYSLTAYSVEELVARDFIINEKPDVVVDVVDASNLERHLYLCCQFLELGVPLVIALNMVDVAEKRGITIDAQELGKRLGVRVVPIVARNGKGVDQLLDAVLDTAAMETPPRPAFLRYGSDVDQALSDMLPDITLCTDLTTLYPQRWLGVKLLEHDEQIVEKARATSPEIAERLLARCDEVANHLQQTLGVYPEAVIADHRYGFIKSIIHQGVVARKFVADRLYTSDKIDKVVTHRLLGPLIMAGVLFALYTFTFSYSTVMVDWLSQFFALISQTVDSLLPDGPFKSMLISGVVDGVGGVMGFVPIIMFMFFGIAVLEDSGYLARVAFMMDRIFHFFGLHGSSVMPFIVSGGIAGGCAVPGVMATRTLRSPKERMATLLTVPFMNCGAKLPVLSPSGTLYVPGHPGSLDRGPLRSQNPANDRAQGGIHPLCHGTAALSFSHSQGAFDPHLGANLAIHEKGGNRHSRNLHPDLGNDDLSGVVRRKDRPIRSAPPTGRSNVHGRFGGTRRRTSTDRG
jgi:ferrous iron transport protein B